MININLLTLNICAFFLVRFCNRLLCIKYSHSCGLMAMNDAYHCQQNSQQWIRSSALCLYYSRRLPMGSFQEHSEHWQLQTHLSGPFAPSWSNARREASTWLLRQPWIYYLQVFRARLSLGPALYKQTHFPKQLQWFKALNFVTGKNKPCAMQRYKKTEFDNF